jgi:phosphoesterase RecJ-like protein
MTTFSPASILDLHKKLSSASNPVIVTHMKPDGDAMGSSIGMYHTIQQIYSHPAKIALANPAPGYLDFLITDHLEEDIYIYEQRPQETEIAIQESDLIICLDFNAFHRTDTLCTILESSKAEKILIDHHLSPDISKFSLVFSQQDISSASELLYHILLQLPAIEGKASGLPIEAATALMTGMTTDTNNFANSVYPSTFEMASQLVDAGVDRNLILSKLYNRSKESRLRLQGYILKDLMKITDDGVAYVVLDKETMYKYNVEEGDTEGFVNIPLTIDNVLMSIFIKEDNGYARVSIRSKQGTSANMCSREHFNGGGHENAAGGRLYIPGDISGIHEAENYIKHHTHIFMNKENE